MKGLVKSFVRKAITRAGYTLTVASASNDLGIQLELLQAAGLRISTVFDIGAHTGEWSREVQPSVPLNTSFYLFEANNCHESSVEDFEGSVHFCVLSDKDGQVDFFSVGGTGDSIFRENSKFFNEVAVDRRDCYRLDTYVDNHSIPRPDFIKIDTQGSELLILEGAGSLLTHVALIYLEIPFLTYNLGAPKFHEYLDFMGNASFIPLAICETHHSSGVLVQVDVLFIAHWAFKEIHDDFDCRDVQRMLE